MIETDRQESCLMFKIKNVSKNTKKAQFRTKIFALLLNMEIYLRIPYLQCVCVCVCVCVRARVVWVSLSFSVAAPVWNNIICKNKSNNLCTTVNLCTVKFAWTLLCGAIFQLHFFGRQPSLSSYCQTILCEVNLTHTEGFSTQRAWITEAKQSFSAVQILILLRGGM